MNRRSTIIIGAMMAVGIVLCPAGTATAAPSPMSGPQYSASAEVAGETWSAPAFPVVCTQSSAQVSCTPSDPAQVSAQQCFARVVVGDARATVCTTYAAHVEAIRAMGGKPLLVQYGCSLGDVVCVTFENAGSGMALAATGLMFLVSEAMRFDTSTLLWTAAVGEWSFWQWGILMVLFGAMVWAITVAVVSGEREELIGAITRSCIAIPAVPTTLWLTGHLLNAVDDMTWYVMTRDGPWALFGTLQSVMWAGGRSGYFFGFLIHGLLMLGMLLLMLVFAFRNIVLAALVMVGPIAWMMFPVRGLGPQWVVRYVSAVVTLLITGPLTIGFVTLIVNGLARVQTIWDPQAWPFIIGLVLVAFAPFAIFGLFSFVGAVAADGLGSNLGARARQAASRATNFVTSIPSRFGGSPSGGRPSEAPTKNTTGPRGGHSSPPGGSTPHGATKPAQAPTPISASAPASGGGTPKRSQPAPVPPTERKVTA